MPGALVVEIPRFSNADESYVERRKSPFRFGVFATKIFALSIVTPTVLKMAKACSARVKYDENGRYWLKPLTPPCESLASKHVARGMQTM